MQNHSKFGVEEKKRGDKRIKQLGTAFVKDIPVIPQSFTHPHLQQ